jgi:hypothetical protein
MIVYTQLGYGHQPQLTGMLTAHLYLTKTFSGLVIFTYMKEVGFPSTSRSTGRFPSSSNLRRRLSEGFSVTLRGLAPGLQHSPRAGSLVNFPPLTAWDGGGGSAGRRSKFIADGERLQVIRVIPSSGKTAGAGGFFIMAQTFHNQRDISTQERRRNGKRRIF